MKSPNTSLNIPADLKKKAQRYALDHDTSLTQLIITALKTYLK